MHHYPFIFVLFGIVVEESCDFSNDPARDMQQQQEHSHLSFVHQTCSPFLIILVIFSSFKWTKDVWAARLHGYGVCRLCRPVSSSHSLTQTQTYPRTPTHTPTSTHCHSTFQVTVVNLTGKSSIRSHQQLKQPHCFYSRCLIIRHTAKSDRFP